MPNEQTGQGQETNPLTVHELSVIAGAGEVVATTFTGRFVIDVLKLGSGLSVWFFYTIYDADAAGDRDPFGSVFSPQPHATAEGAISAAMLAVRVAETLRPHAAQAIAARNDRNEALRKVAWAKDTLEQFEGFAADFYDKAAGRDEVWQAFVESELEDGNHLEGLTIDDLRQAAGLDPVAA